MKTLQPLRRPQRFFFNIGSLLRPIESPGWKCASAHSHITIGISIEKVAQRDYKNEEFILYLIHYTSDPKFCSSRNHSVNRPLGLLFHPRNSPYLWNRCTCKIRKSCSYSIYVHQKHLPLFSSSTEIKISCSKSRRPIFCFHLSLSFLCIMRPFLSLL